MRILVTGGAGFIGSHLIDRLLGDGHTIICVDSLISGSQENIAHHTNHPAFRFLVHDIVEPLCIEEKIDQIYNLACPGSPIQYQKNAVRTIKSNTIGMMNMLGVARKHGARLLQASTSEVYGDPAVHPQPESYHGNVNPIGPRACYDEGKRCAETLCFDYHRMHGMEIKVARIFNTYGPRMAAADGRVVSSFLVQALRGEPVTVFGDGMQTRSFCYVPDLVGALVLLMDSAADITGPINLGNTQEYTIKEIAQKIIEKTDSASRIETLPLPEDDPRQRRPDLSLAKKVLGWEPSVSFDEGLAKTIDDFRARLLT